MCKQFAKIQKFILDKSSSYDPIRDTLKELELKIKHWSYYEWVFFNGVDSDDAKRHIRTTNDPEDLLKHDLLYGAD